MKRYAVEFGRKGQDTYSVGVRDFGRSLHARVKKRRKGGVPYFNSEILEDRREGT
jgi:hypothetical protein